MFDNKEYCARLSEVAVAAAPLLYILTLLYTKAHNIWGKGFSDFWARFDFVLRHESHTSQLMGKLFPACHSRVMWERLINSSCTYKHCSATNPAKGDQTITSKAQPTCYSSERVDCYCPLAGTVNKLIVYKLWMGKQFDQQTANKQKTVVGKNHHHTKQRHNHINNNFYDHLCVTNVTNMTLGDWKKNENLSNYCH
jgi:hypothetical protein